jgi:soluble lytic murein transglycosylase
MCRKILKFGVMLILVFIKFPITLIHAGTNLSTNNMGKLVHLALHHASKLRTRPYFDTISLAIMCESLRFGFDPILLISIIQTESNFSIKKHGRHGEIGLMQVKPSTGRWIAKMNGFPWHGAKTLENPAINIQLGTAYLSFLRKKFSDQHNLYLAAYNVGTGRLRKAIQRQTIPKQYTSQVLRRYSTLQSQVLNPDSTVSL